MRVLLLLVIVSFERLQSFDVDEYLSSIDQLTVDESFFDEYTQRSLELFSHSDYLYGKASDRFPCYVPPRPLINETRSVHRLRPSDIQCVGALGDSLTAALGAHAITPAGLIVENRGSSWSIGGDYQFTRMISLPNILREFNPQLKGYSKKSSIIFLQGQNGSHNGLNVGTSIFSSALALTRCSSSFEAKSGDRSYHMIDQAKILLQRIQSNEFCHWSDDWKLLTIFVGVSLVLVVTD